MDLTLTIFHFHQSFIKIEFCCKQYFDISVVCHYFKDYYIIIKNQRQVYSVMNDQFNNNSSDPNYC